MNGNVQLGVLYCRTTHLSVRVSYPWPGWREVSLTSSFTVRALNPVVMTQLKNVESDDKHPYPNTAISKLACMYDACQHIPTRHNSTDSVPLLTMRVADCSDVYLLEIFFSFFFFFTKVMFSSALFLLGQLYFFTNNNVFIYVFL